MGPAGCIEQASPSAQRDCGSSDDLEEELVGYDLKADDFAAARGRERQHLSREDDENGNEEKGSAARGRSLTSAALIPLAYVAG